jgi:hypothetical protein
MSGLVEGGAVGLEELILARTGLGPQGVAAVRPYTIITRPS